MPVAVVDANVLFAWRSGADQYHDRGSEICSAASDNDLPQLWIPEVFLQEAIKHVHNEAGYDDAVETLDAIVRDQGFAIVSLREADYDRGRAIFRQYDDLELPDSIAVAYMRREELSYIYTFDGDFGVFPDITALNTATNPFVPE